MRELRRVLFTIITAYLVIVLAMYMFQRSLMYFPDAKKADVSGGAQEFTVTTQDGLDITGWSFFSNANAPVLLYFHGNALGHADRLYRVQPYLDRGYNVVLAGYRGYSANPGTPSEAGLYQDAHAYMRALKNLGFQEDQIILYGESLGTGVAVELAQSYQGIKALVLEAPYSSTVDVAAWRFPIIPVGFLMKDRFESDKKIKDVKAPVIIQHGTQDNVIPFKFGKKLYEAANQPKHMIVVEGAGHNDLLENGGALQILDILKNL